ncbi:2,4-dihydroxyhept-2-ene-1,7-dioic acid aldolase [Bordetella genomosp. 10]|uniref:2,4-dihydroxyhept-2-ene-1,7-dioic acid aldolase n=1 Tax=Bordetella genomosp. 10 TaxID=1416804 RepID=A0A261S0K8_9BORD|nr:aldolase/citrate lyase family protein [Bordetella genomosp. 10]OZI30671.1 2,4-dihydroxyhept-2-ene-1,7-dioic acid aldolase [Bordetella genomosp. 10]
MRPNSTKDRFLAGKPIVNGWLSIPSSYAAEVIARQGFHAVTVDVQHGMMGFETAMSMLQAISSTDATPMVRCPSLDEPTIMRLLDAGAYGVICPQIDNADMAARFVAACRYAPEGNRSFGPARGPLYAGPDYFEQANHHVLALAMIESQAALDNLDAILATPGLDGIYVGPNDLALSLGMKPGAETGGIVAEAIARIVAATRARGLLAGIFCASSALARQRLAEGFHLVTPGNDANMLGLVCKARIEETLAGQSAPAAGATAGY